MISSASTSADEPDIVANLPPLHPGEVLREEFLRPLGLSAGKVAKAAGVPRTRIERIVAERLGVSADTAVRLAHVLGTSPTFWVNLQGRYDIETATTDLAPQIDTFVRLNPA